MASINLVVLSGRLVKEPEMCVGNKNQTEYSRNTIAVPRTFNKNECDFIDFTTFGKTAKFLCDYGRKGSFVEIIGKIEINQYTDKDGTKKSYTNINVNEINIVPTQQAEPKKEDTAPYVPKAYEAYDPSFDEKLPF